MDFILRTVATEVLASPPFAGKLEFTVDFCTVFFFYWPQRINVAHFSDPVMIFPVLP